MKAPTRQAVLDERRRFASVFGLGLPALIAIHLAPLSRFPLNAPYNGLRLLCAIAYFTALITLCRHLMGPRSRYMALLYAWRFAECPPAMEQTWRQYLYSLDSAVNALCRLAIAFLASTAMSILAAWFPFVSVFRLVYNPVWWFSFLGLILFPFAGGFLMNEAIQRGRALHEMMTIYTDYKPRSARDLDRKEESVDPPGDIKGGRAGFRAGGEEWQWENLTKNVIVFGQTGSGKTICALNAFVDGLLASPPCGSEPAGALILDPKGDFRGKLEILCRGRGRENDLVILDPERPDVSLRWNPFDSPDDAYELASRFVAAMEALGMKSNDTSVWADSSRKFLKHAITLVRLTNPPGQPPSFDAIGRLVSTRDEIVARANRLDLNDASTEHCLLYFAAEWAELAPETRTSIQMHITNMIDPFLVEPYASIFSGPSTLRVAQMIDQGKIVYVDMPVADREQMARLAGTLMKLEYFREVRKRVGKKRPTFFLCDEFQRFFTTAQGKGDADEFEVTRQSNHANIIATQNLPSLLKQTSGQNRSTVDNLLGNCAVKIFLRNTDRETNQYASELFGQDLIAMPGSNTGAGHFGVGRFGFRGLGRQVSSHVQYDARLRPERLGELAIPSEADGVDYCEAIIHHAARATIDHRRRLLRLKVHPITTETHAQQSDGEFVNPLMEDDPCFS
jgi:Type IV secretion-system coupling protein DNA-binding domain